MKILKYNIKKPTFDIQFDYEFNYRGLTRKERRDNVVVVKSGTIPIRKYYSKMIDQNLRKYQNRIHKYEQLCEQKRKHLIKQITK